MPTTEKNFTSYEEMDRWVSSVRETNQPQHIRLIIEDIDETTDPWVQLVNNIENHAIDTGIPDLAENHDHYLYGLNKKSK